MRRLILITGIVAVTASEICAQDPLDFNTINTETYRLYMAGQWDSVIDMGKLSLRQETDFYYLRMRMGIAYYQQKNYRMAACHYKKALKLNQADPAALEQLYYSCLMSGKTEHAMLVRKQFKGDMSLRLPPPKGKFADRIDAGYLYNHSLNDNQLLVTGGAFQDLPPGLQYVTRHFSNYTLALQQRIAPGFRLSHAYNFLSKYNHLYYNDGFNQVEIPDQHVYQHQYFISPSITSKFGCTFTPMFHLVSIHYETPVYLDQGNQGGNSQMMLSVQDKTEFVAGLGINRGFGMVDVNLGGWYANLNNAKQWQGRLGITWYPLGNLNLYAGAYLNSQYETMEERVSTTRHIPELHLGWTVAEKVWFDLNGAIGDMIHYLEQNGSIIYNSFSDAIQKKVNFTVSVPITEKGSLVYLGGRWTENRSEFFAFDQVQYDNTNTIQYQTISIYGGVSWKF